MQKARKRFGQNFLIDQNIISRIASAVNPGSDDRIIEIGPGRGAITEKFYSAPGELTLIEIDRDLAAQLAERFPNARLITDDVMQIEMDTLYPDQRIRIVGNLPYNISTPLLFRLLTSNASIRDMHFMLQLEVVNRMAAQPSTKAYGRLSVMTQLHCHVEKLFDVPPEAFSPRPKVRSAIVRLMPHRTPINIDHGVVEGLLIQAFSARRKTIRNAFQGLLTVEDIQSLGLDASLRPENLSVEDYVACANLIGSRA